MVPHVIRQLITREQKHMVPHVIRQLITKEQNSHGSPCDSTIIKRKHNPMVHMISTLTCESQCIMTKSNP
jgi:hypothetical protein